MNKKKFFLIISIVSLLVLGSLSYIITSVQKRKQTDFKADSTILAVDSDLKSLVYSGEQGGGLDQDNMNFYFIKDIGIQTEKRNLFALPVNQASSNVLDSKMVYYELKNENQEGKIIFKELDLDSNKGEVVLFTLDKKGLNLTVNNLRLIKEKNNYWLSFSISYTEKDYENYYDTVFVNEIYLFNFASQEVKLIHTRPGKIEKLDILGFYKNRIVSYQHNTEICQGDLLVLNIITNEIEKIEEGQCLKPLIISPNNQFIFYDKPTQVYDWIIFKNSKIYDLKLNQFISLDPINKEGSEIDELGKGSVVNSVVWSADSNKILFTKKSGAIENLYLVPRPDDFGVYSFDIFSQSIRKEYDLPKDDRMVELKEESNNSLIIKEYKNDLFALSQLSKGGIKELASGDQLEYIGILPAIKN